MCEICGATVDHRAGCPEFRDADPDVYGTKYHEDCFTDAYLKQG